LLLSSSGAIYADVGDPLRVLALPVPSPTNVGIGLAVDCEGSIYYTNSFSPILHKIDANGALLSSVNLVDPATGGRVSIGALAWDGVRQKLWGGSDNAGIPVRIYQIDPATGQAEFRFNAVNSTSFGFAVGLAYDQSDDSVWFADDVANVVDHLDARTGADLGPITPLGPTAERLGSLSGIVVGTDGKLFVGQADMGMLVRIDRETGAFIDSFATPGGRDADIECDNVTFPGSFAVWSRDIFDDFITAIEVQPDACGCGGCPGTWTYYGQGVAGSGAAVPSITTGCPDTGTMPEVQVTNGPGGALGCLLLGNQQAVIPAFGGTVLVLPYEAFTHVLDGTLPGEGTTTIRMPIPNDVTLPGSTFFFQSGYFDVGGPAGFALSNGMRVVIG
jgi:hypothetical protein